MAKRNVDDKIMFRNQNVSLSLYDKKLPFSNKMDANLNFQFRTYITIVFLSVVFAIAAKRIEICGLILTVRNQTIYLQLPSLGLFHIFSGSLTKRANLNFHMDIDSDVRHWSITLKHWKI